MKRTTIAILSVAVLAPLFAAAQEAQAPARPGETPAEKRPPTRMLVRESLGLTPEQEKSLEGFRKARVEESQAFREEMTKLRGEMRALVQDPKADATKIDALIDKTAKLRAEREKAAFRNRAERDKIFTPGQLEKIKAFRARFAGRAGLAGPGRMGFGRMGFRGPGMGRFRGWGSVGRFRSFRHRPYRWRRW